MSRTAICVAEDREVCEPALRLLVLSLKRHWDVDEIHLFHPPASSSFVKWLAAFRRVHLDTTEVGGGCGWNIKPRVIMKVLDRGFDEVIWIDSDVILCGDASEFFSGIGTDVLVATEDAAGPAWTDRDGLRARLWGLPVGRCLPFGLNTGVVRATRCHYALMTRWWELMQSEEYQAAQKIDDWFARPIHMLGDQDVLTALLTSEDFCDVPLKILRRGRGIIQYHGFRGYRVVERLANLFAGGPLFVHSGFGVGKPWLEWRDGRGALGLMDRFRRLHLDLSPYTIYGLKYQAEMSCETEWMHPHSLMSWGLRAFGLGYPPLVGLPVAMIADALGMFSLLWGRCSTVSLLETRGRGWSGQ